MKFVARRVGTALNRKTSRLRSLLSLGLSTKVLLANTRLSIWADKATSRWNQTRMGFKGAHPRSKVSITGNKHLISCAFADNLGKGAFMTIFMVSLPNLPTVFWEQYSLWIPSQITAMFSACEPGRASLARKAMQLPSRFASTPKLLLCIQSGTKRLRPPPGITVGWRTGCAAGCSSRKA